MEADSATKAQLRAYVGTKLSKEKDRLECLRAMQGDHYEAWPFIGKVDQRVLDLETKLAQLRIERPKAGWVVLRDLNISWPSERRA